jgi:alkylation response protein AidB-like acyl-CoA dehydrogenase
MTTTTQSDDIIATMKALRPEIESYSDEGQRLRRLPDGLTRLFKEHGIFGMSRPVEYGGMGADLITTMRTVEEISVADASAGWVAAIGSNSIGMAGLSGDIARQIFKPGTALAGVGAPSGRAAPAEGGYRITGRWSYASGCQNSEWIGLGNIVFEGETPRMLPSGQPDFRIAVLPMSEVEVIDTWQVAGLRGTGSHDVAVSDVFVPDERTSAVSLDSSVSGEGPSAIPMFTLFGLALAPVALGAARRAIDELVALAQGKTPMLAGTKLREKPVVQYEIARAEGILQGGRAYLYETLNELTTRAHRGEAIDMELRARAKLATTHATDCAAQAVEIAYRLGGGTSNFEASVLQRCLRDVNAVTQHFMVSSSNYETAGRVLMGLDPGTPLI